MFQVGYVNSPPNETWQEQGITQPTTNLFEGISSEIRAETHEFARTNTEDTDVFQSVPVWVCPVTLASGDP